MRYGYGGYTANSFGAYTSPLMYNLMVGEHITGVSGEWGVNVGSHYISRVQFTTSNNRVLGPYGTDTGTHQGSFGGPGWKLVSISGPYSSGHVPEFLNFHFIC